MWLSNLYVSFISQPRRPSALITAGGLDLYMTGMTLAGNGGEARVVHVKERGSLFVSSAHTP